MQINDATSSGFKSMGIPPHMRANIDRTERDKREAAESALKKENSRPAMTSQGMPRVENPGMPRVAVDDYPAVATTEATYENTTTEELEDAPPVKDPVEALKDDYDIEITSDDIQRILFKGYTEKDVVVVPSIMGSEPLVATFKTLTGKEYEEADEKLAEDIRDSRMTNDGFASRRGLWLLAYSLKKIQGRLYYRPKFLDEAKKKLDRKATLEIRKEALNNFSPVVLSKMMEIQANLTVAINYIFANKADAVKKP